LRKENDVMNPGQTIILADSVQSELERARETEDLKVIRQHIDTAIETMSVIVKIAKEAAP
jgi:hypothetical protein